MCCAVQGHQQGPGAGPTGACLHIRCPIRCAVLWPLAGQAHATANSHEHQDGRHLDCECVWCKAQQGGRIASEASADRCCGERVLQDHVARAYPARVQHRPHVRAPAAAARYRWTQRHAGAGQQLVSCEAFKLIVRQTALRSGLESAAGSGPPGGQLAKGEMHVVEGAACSVSSVCLTPQAVDEEPEAAARCPEEHRAAWQRRQEAAAAAVHACEGRLHDVLDVAQARQERSRARKNKGEHHCRPALHRTLEGASSWSHARCLLPGSLHALVTPTVDSASGSRTPHRPWQPRRSPRRCLHPRLTRRWPGTGPRSPGTCSAARLCWRRPAAWRWTGPAP